MSVSITVGDWIVDKIQALSSVEKVYPYETLQFSGYPAVVVTLPQMEGEFSSTAENSRLFSYTIQIFFPLGQDIEKPKTMPREQYAEGVIATVLDDIIDALDTSFTAGGLDLPSVYTVKYLEAADFRPFYAEIENGLHRGAEVTIRVYTERTVV